MATPRGANEGTIFSAMDVILKHHIGPQRGSHSLQSAAGERMGSTSRITMGARGHRQGFSPSHHLVLRPYVRCLAAERVIRRFNNSRSFPTDLKLTLKAAARELWPAWNDVAVWAN